MSERVLIALSFTVAVGTLFALSHVVQTRLKAAGYDVGDLILLGLPKNDSLSAPQFLDPIGLLLSLNMTSFEVAGFDVGTFATQNQKLLTFAVGGILLFAIGFVGFGPKKRKPVLDGESWKEFPLKEKIVISHNTAIYRFALPRADDVLGLPIGQHISVAAEINGKNVIRSYTPTSSDDEKGHFDLLIKSYEQGNISKHVSLLKIGQAIRVKGPKGQFNYTPSLSRELGMIAGGTGITPMFQIIKAAAKNPLDRTQISLIYANVSEEDILLRTELDAIAAAHSRIKVYYVLQNPPAGWQGGVGFVSKQMIEERLPSSDHNIKILMCGPPPMNAAMKKHLEELKFPAPRAVSKLVDQVFLF